MKRLVVFGLPVLLLGGWGALFLPSFAGWGYAGHRGFHRAPSFFYSGDAETFHDRSVRGSASRARGQGGK